LAEGLLAEAGLATIVLAKQTGTWTALDQASALIVAPKMNALFDRNADAKANWNMFPPSTKRGILEWIYNAKSPETKLKRINETVQLAAKNELALQWTAKN